MAGEPDGDKDGAQAWGCAQQAKADRAGLEDVVRIDGQECGGAPEQHSEEIERDGAENFGALADEGQAAEEGFQAWRFKGGFSDDGRHLEGREAGGEEYAGADGVDDAGAQAIEQAAQGRANDGGGLEHGGGEGGGAGEEFGRYERREEGLQAGCFEGFGGADDENEGVDHGRRQMVGEGGGGQRQGRGAGDGLADGGNAAAV